MKNTKKVEKEEMTISELGTLMLQLHNIVLEKIDISFDELSSFMGRGFNRLYERLNNVEDTLTLIEKRVTNVEGGLQGVGSTMATKQDLLVLYDKFVPYYKFDELSLRVSKLEDSAE